MPKKIGGSLIISLRVIVVLITIAGISGIYAQVPRFYVDITVTNGDLGEGIAYSVAMEFIEVIDFEGLSQLEAPDKGFVDPESLKKFLPPLLKGSRAHTEVVDSLKTNYAECWAHVGYFREAEDQNIWDEIQIFIRDGGKYTKSKHKAMMNLNLKKDTDTTTIKGFEASVYRNPRNELDEVDEIRVVVAVPAKSIDWNKVVEAAKEGVRKGVKIWSVTAKFKNGSINASVLMIPPGSLEGPSFERTIIDEIMALEVPVKIANAFALPVWSGWQHWSLTFNATYDNAFPSFTDFKGASSPPTPAAPIPVVSASFDRENLTAENLKSRIIKRLGKWEEDPEAKKAAADFAQWFDECFTKAVAKARIENLMGRGPVPTYAPPKIPSGPVVGGEVIGSPVTFTDFEF